VSLALASGLRGRLARHPAFIILLLAMFSGAVGLGMVSPLLPIFAKDMGASGVWLGLAFSGFTLTQMPLMPLFGRLSDRWGKRRPFMAAGLAVYALVAIGMLLAPNFYILVLMRVLGGVGAALLFPIASAYAGDITPPGREGMFMGVFQVSFTMGWGVGPLLGGTLTDAYGMDAAFASQAALACVALAVVLLRLPEPSSRTEEEDEGHTPLSAILRLPPVRALIAFQTAWSFNNGILMTFVALYLTEDLGASAAIVGAIMTTRVLMNGSLQVLGGSLADRVSRPLLMVAGMIAAAAVVFTIPWAQSIAVVWVLFALAGAAEAFSMPAASAMATETGRGTGMGAIMGVFHTSFSVGMVVGALVGGLVADMVGLREVFRLGPVVQLIGAAVLIALTMNARSGRPAPAFQGPRQA
jgi:MFS family permease